MSNNPEKVSPKAAAKGLKGELTEQLGAVTGDRRVEAAGKVEREVADPEAPIAEKTTESVDEQQQAVRRAHHDI